jgi:hypothetical protein
MPEHAPKLVRHNTAERKIVRQFALREPTNVMHLERSVSISTSLA